MDTQLLLDNVNRLANDLAKTNHATREQLLSEIDKLRLSIETPLETVLRIGYQPWQHSAIRVAIELHIFAILTDAGENGIDIDMLAFKAGADVVLMTRLMRMLVALGLCAGDPKYGYKANSKTAILSIPQGTDCFRIWADLSAPTAVSLTTYFQTRGWSNPEQAEQSAFANAFGEEFWTWKSKNPHHSAVFDSFMASRRIGRPLWFDIYPFQDRILNLSTSEHTSLVDIGGNRGHDLIKFRDRFPELSGRLILQDLPEVLSQIEDRPKGIELMPHNFFCPQPVRGAKAYLFRAIFHDWPTDRCQQILQETAAAMTLGYSKLLISDFVLDDNDPHVFSASLDLQMMGLHCGMERSEDEWRSLLNSAGLKITKIFRRTKASEAIIEAELIGNGGSDGSLDSIGSQREAPSAA